MPTLFLAWNRNFLNQSHNPIYLHTGTDFTFQSLEFWQIKNLSFDVKTNPARPLSPHRLPDKMRDVKIWRRIIFADGDDM
jgi:hypothetical protein